MPRGEGGRSQNGKGMSVYEGRRLFDKALGRDPYSEKNTNATAKQYTDKFGAVNKAAWEASINAMPDEYKSTRSVEIDYGNSSHSGDRPLRGFRERPTHRTEEYMADNRRNKQAARDAMNSWFNNIDNKSKQSSINHQVMMSNMMNDNSAVSVNKQAASTAADVDADLTGTGLGGKKKRTKSMSTTLGVD